MSAEGKDWIVDVLYDVQEMLKSNGLTETADALSSTILLSLLEIANIEHNRIALRTNVLKFTG